MTDAEIARPLELELQKLFTVGIRTIRWYSAAAGGCILGWISATTSTACGISCRPSATSGRTKRRTLKESTPCCPPTKRPFAVVRRRACPMMTQTT